MEESQAVLGAFGIGDVDDGDTVIVVDMVKRHVEGQTMYAVLIASLWLG